MPLTGDVNRGRTNKFPWIRIHILEVSHDTKHNCDSYISHHQMPLKLLTYKNLSKVQIYRVSSFDMNSLLLGIVHIFNQQHKNYNKYFQYTPFPK